MDALDALANASNASNFLKTATEKFELVLQWFYSSWTMSNKPDHTYILLFGEFDDNQLTIGMSQKDLQNEPITSNVNLIELANPLDSVSRFC